MTERFKIASRAPFTDADGVLTAHGLKVLLALSRAAGGSADGVIPLASEQEVWDLLEEIKHVTAIANAAEAKAEDGLKAVRRLDDLVDPVALFGQLQDEINRIRRDIDELKNSIVQPDFSDIFSLKTRLDEVEQLCQQTLGAL